MFMTLALVCCSADDATFNGLKAAEWVAMAKDDALPRRRKAAVMALGQLVTDQSKDAVLPPVARAMRNDSQASVRLQAALVLGQLPAETLAAYIPDLTEGLRQEKDPAVKRAQATALGRLGKAAQAAVLPLIEALKDAAPVKAAAADALGRIGTGANGAVAALTPLVADADRSVRLAAVFALGRIDPPEPDAVAATLIGVLTNAKIRHAKLAAPTALAGGAASLARESELVAAAVVSLGLIAVKSSEAVRALAEQFSDPDADVRQQAALALSKLTVAARAAETELKAAVRTDVDKLVRTYAVQTLATAFATEPETLITFLAEHLKVEREADVRLAIVDELGALGAAGTAAIPSLREAQRDTQVKVREAATLAIRRITKPAIVPAKP